MYSRPNKNYYRLINRTYAKQKTVEHLTNDDNAGKTKQKTKQTKNQNPARIVSI